MDEERRTFNVWATTATDSTRNDGLRVFLLSAHRGHLHTVSAGRGAPFLLRAAAGDAFRLSPEPGARASAAVRGSIGEGTGRRDGRGLARDTARVGYGAAGTASLSRAGARTRARGGGDASAAGAHARAEAVRSRSRTVFGRRVASGRDGRGAAGGHGTTDGAGRDGAVTEAPGRPETTRRSGSATARARQRPRGGAPE